jgi:hypothetical protein
MVARLGTPIRLSQADHATLRFTTCTDSAAAARSTVEALTFRAVTRTLLFDYTWQSTTNAMLLVSSEASAKSPRRAPATVTSTFAVAPGPRLGRSQVVSSARLPSRPAPIGSDRAQPTPRRLARPAATPRVRFGRQFPSAASQ